MIHWQDIGTYIRNGKLICIYDFPDREAETDVVCIGSAPDAQTINFMRRQVGGVQTVYIAGQLLERLNISTFSQYVLNSGIKNLITELVQQNRGNNPRFALTLDARSNKTGCSPIEVARTVQLLYELMVESSCMDNEALKTFFLEHFITPGHVSIIRGADHLLLERNGHAELSLSLAKAFNVPQIVSACELIHPITLMSMTYAEAKDFAEQHGIPFITGDDILEFVGIVRAGSPA